MTYSLKRHRQVACVLMFASGLAATYSVAMYFFAGWNALYLLLAAMNWVSLGINAYLLRVVVNNERKYGSWKERGFTHDQ